MNWISKVAPKLRNFLQRRDVPENLSLLEAAEQLLSISASAASSLVQQALMLAGRLAS